MPCRNQAFCFLSGVAHVNIRTFQTACNESSNYITYLIIRTLHCLIWFKQLPNENYKRFLHHLATKWFSFNVHDLTLHLTRKHKCPIVMIVNDNSDPTPLSPMILPKCIEVGGLSNICLVSHFKVKWIRLYILDLVIL